jgi:hypothetical protein
MMNTESGRGFTKPDFLDKQGGTFLASHGSAGSASGSARVHATLGLTLPHSDSSFVACLWKLLFSMKNKRVNPDNQ